MDPGVVLAAAKDLHRQTLAGQAPAQMPVASFWELVWVFRQLSCSVRQVFQCTLPCRDQPCCCLGQWPLHYSCLGLLAAPCACHRDPLRTENSKLRAGAVPQQVQVWPRAWKNKSGASAPQTHEAVAMFAQSYLWNGMCRRTGPEC